MSRPESVHPNVTYRILGAHGHAGGLYVKDAKLGSEIRANTLYRVEQGDFVYSRLFAWKGSFAIASADDHGCYVSGEFPCFHVVGDLADSGFLRWYFSRPVVWEEALSLSAGGTPISRNRLREDKLLSMRIPLPPLDEQRRIVERIEALAGRTEEARALRRSAVNALEALLPTSRNRIYTEAAKRGVKRLDQLATLERGKFSHRPRNDPRFFGGTHPWIQIAEIQRSGKYIRDWSETLNDDGLAISRKFPQGTLLISIAATIGAIGILGFDCCVPDSVVAITPKDDVDSEYLYHFLGHARGHLEQIAPQSAQRNINLAILSALPVPWLPMPEQRIITSYLNETETKADALKNIQSESAAELDALLPSILDRAFRGEL